MILIRKRLIKLSKPINKPKPFNHKQINYINATKNNWFNVLEGGKRGSKNVVNTYAFWLHLETCKEKLHLIAGISQSTAKINILDCDDYGLLNYFKGRCREGKYKDRDCIYIHTITGIKIVLVAGGDNKNSHRYIKGFTLGSAYVTESNDCHQNFIKEVFDRTLSSDNRKVFHDLNPRGEQDWYYTEVLNIHEKNQREEKDYGYNYCHTTIADNSSISDKRLSSVLSTYDKNSLWYNRDILGLRISAKGLIYTTFVNNKKHYLIDDVKEYLKTTNQHLEHVLVGVDFGHNPEKSVNTFVAVGITNKFKIVVLDELYLDEETLQRDNRKYTKDSLDTSLLHAYFEKFIRYINKDYGACYVFADSAEPMLVRGLKSTVIAKSLLAEVNPVSKKKILTRISFANSMFGLNRIKISDSCKYLIKAFETALWNEKSKSDERLDDGTTNIDSLDAFEYSLSKMMISLETMAHKEEV